MQGRKPRAVQLLRVLPLAALLFSAARLSAETLVLLDRTQGEARMSLRGRLLDWNDRPLPLSRILAYRTDGAFAAATLVNTDGSFAFRGPA